MLSLLIVKWIIWAVALGSGTSGGVLAPLLMMGGALGGVMATVLPNEGVGFWPLISMGAILGGTMRSPFTGVIFALELTHDVTVLLPLMVAAIIAHGFTVLTLRRSILTEKVSRRGYHLSREYATDPLEIIFVREVMRSKVPALSPSITVKDLARSLRSDHRRSQRLYAVVDAEDHLLGVVTRNDLQTFVQAHPAEDETHQLAEIVRPDPVKAYADEPLRVVVHRMAETGFTWLPVVERSDPRKLRGVVSLDDLLIARVRNLKDEHHRERVLNIRRLLAPARPATASEQGRGDKAR